MRPPRGPNLINQTCGVDGCERRAAYAKPPHCNMHHQRWLRHGPDMNYSPESIKRVKKTEPCKETGCEKTAKTRGWCPMHYRRWRLYGDPNTVIQKQRTGKPFIDSYGYALVYIPEHPNSQQNGYVSQHTLVMSRGLGRAMRKGEFVHHKNGVKTDNKLENLELWTRGHPAGQRVSDLQDYAIEILNEYGWEMELPY